MSNVQGIQYPVFSIGNVLPKSEFGSGAPRKIGLNWFMPAFAKRSVGSSSGIVEEDGTYA
jgi:hypothetical protein